MASEGDLDSRCCLEPREASSAQPVSSAALRAQGDKGELRPAGKGWRWFIPRRGERLFKTRFVVCAALGLLLLRVAYVQVCYFFVMRDLKREGYVKNLSYYGAASEQWIHPSDPNNRKVTLYWFPRPKGSPIQKVDDLLRGRAGFPDGKVTGQSLIFVRFALMWLTRPFLTPVVTHSGFDPEKKMKEAFMQRMPKDNQDLTSRTLNRQR